MAAPKIRTAKQAGVRDRSKPKKGEKVFIGETEVKRVYYARPLAMMGTKEDTANIAELQKRFPKAKLDWASTKECKEPKKMTKYFKRTEKAQLVVVAEVSAGALSRGVHAEATHALHNGIPVQVIRPTGLKTVEALPMLKNPGTKWSKVKTQKS